MKTSFVSFYSDIHGFVYYYALHNLYSRISRLYFPLSISISISLFSFNLEMLRFYNVYIVLRCIKVVNKKTSVRLCTLFRYIVFNHFLCRFLTLQETLINHSMSLLYIIIWYIYISVLDWDHACRCAVCAILLRFTFWYKCLIFYCFPFCISFILIYEWRHKTDWRQDSGKAQWWCLI